MRLSILLTTLLLCACRGPQGDVGAKGLTGNPGTPGLNGSGCTVTAVQASQAAPNGGSLITCGNNTSALVVNGTDGASGTLADIVQFCPGNFTYPSSFPEIGFRINGLIYTVYSANGGFLTEVPPGAYFSNAVGSTCNFTVNADGTITN